MVSPHRLRFDFSHFEAMTPDQLKEVERLVNQGVRANLKLCTTVMDIEEAMSTGAMALFEERYGDRVRLVEIPGLSKELCGGTHAARTGDIGLFKILSESSVAAGVRRLEALTGGAALEAVQAMEGELLAAAGALKANRSELAEKAARVQAALKESERAVDELKARLAGAGARDLLAEAQELGGVKVLVTEVAIDNPKALREVSDDLHGRMGSGVMVLGAKSGGKALLLVRVTKDQAGRFHAGNLVKELAPMVGGGGGGKSELAQAGGTKPEGFGAKLWPRPRR